MKIKRLEVCGFKSFVDRSVVHFDHDVTGIVGPNGCGKSNIVDAIRWSMGEQSAKNLRGKAMDDVIFNGSENRGPAGFAEVTLTFDNSDGLAPAEYRDYAEIAISRRLDRSGKSDYFINKTPVRLMDITNLFLGTGVGKRAYSIIEQGRVGFIVSSKPEERRHLIEEAAGITKFKARKKAAERKMEQTQHNLLRVGDIVQEIERSLSSLKRQAQKAERYKRYREEMRELELHVASHKWLELKATQRVVGSELDRAQAESEGVDLALRMREAEMDSGRQTLLAAEQDVEQAQTRAYELDNKVRLLESQLEHQLERLGGLREAEQRLEREGAELVAQKQETERERELLQAALATLEENEAEAQGILERETEGLETRKAAATEAERGVVNARAQVSEAQSRIARAETALTAFERRREEGRARLERQRSEREELSRRIVELDQEAGELKARLTGLSSGKQKTAEYREQLETELVNLREELKSSEAEVTQVRDELTERRSRLRSLEQIQRRFEGVDAGVRAVMSHFGDEPEMPHAGGQNHRGKKNKHKHRPQAEQKPVTAATEAQKAAVQGLLADRLDCAPEFTHALAGALGDRLQYIVVNDVPAAMDVVSFLREHERGRATVVPQTPRWTEKDWGAAPEADGVKGWLADLVRYADEDRDLVRHLVSGVLVVDTLETAVRLYDKGVSCASIVTLTGDLLGFDGALSGGAGDESGAHMLEVKREIRELTEVVSRLDTELAAATEKQGELRKAIASRQAEVDAARSEAHGAEIAIVKAEKDLRRAEQDAEQMRKRAERMDGELGELSEQLDAAGEEEAEAEHDLAEAREQREDAEGALESAEEIHGQKREAVEEQAARVTEVRVRFAQAKERAESDRGALTRIERQFQELEQRTSRWTTDVHENALDQGELIGLVVNGKEALREHEAHAKAAEVTLSKARAAYDEARAAVADDEMQLKSLRSRLDAMGKRVTELTFRERELAYELDHLLDHVGERHRVDIREVLCDFHAREIPDASIKARVDELIKLIERMGEINLTAIDEYKEKSERYEYLSAQKKDLEDALTQLERAIRQMNQESKRLFKDAFDAVNERFTKVFPTMFGGGKAELRLTDPNNLVESGVEIYAQPPGKKVGSLELMSGGEKALTAVSLIFAIFQYKPSPFCLLDEVDAPLDEANIGRFSDAIRQMTARSQFIVITHAKRTMETADVLYGVTMETPGVSKLVSVELSGDRARRGGSGSARATRSAVA